MRTPKTTSISVIIPVYNGAHYLPMSLRHLRESAQAPLECIVVDDGSTDDSVAVAQEYGATVLSTGGRKGPAHARNLGAQAARGDVLFFIDSDVCVHADTLARITWAFEQDAELDAVIGSYDDTPGAKDFLSLYKNLMHCYMHQHGHERACTFWSGCGAIRREVFLEYSGFDSDYEQPAIEDIELGYRLVRGGRKLLLDRHLLVKHLKRWTFWNLVKTDILSRGIPWTELILRDRSMPNDLNLQMSQRISVALVFILFGLATAGAIRYGGYFLTPILAMLFFVLGRYWVEAAMAPRSKSVLIAVTVLVAAFVWLAYEHYMLPMVPPVLLGYVLLFLRHRYARGTESRRFVTGIIHWVYLAFVVIFCVTFLPRRPLVYAFYMVLLIIVFMNNQFYIFLGPRFGWLSTLTAIPFHLLYHFYNGISFLVGLAKYGWNSLFGRHRQLSPRAGNGKTRVADTHVSLFR